MAKAHNLVTYKTDKSTQEVEAGNRFTNASARDILLHSDLLNQVLTMALTGVNCYIRDDKMVIDEEDPLPHDIRQKYALKLVDKAVNTPKDDQKDVKKETNWLDDLELISAAEEVEQKKEKFISEQEVIPPTDKPLEDDSTDNTNWL